MAQSLSQIYVRLVFSTKHRAPLLRDPRIRGEMHAYMAQVFNSMKSTALLVGGTEDHIHSLIIMARTQDVADVTKNVKHGTSVWIKTKGVEYERFAWQEGYGAFSVSHSLLPNVKRYIANQETHHRKKDFKDEFRALLRKHEIEFDERYVWD